MPGPRMNGHLAGRTAAALHCPPCPSISSAKPAFLPPNPPTPSLCPSGEAQGHRPERPPRLQPLPLQTKEGPAQIPEFAACTERARDWRHRQREVDAAEVFFAPSARHDPRSCRLVARPPCSRCALLFSHTGTRGTRARCQLPCRPRLAHQMQRMGFLGLRLEPGQPPRTAMQTRRRCALGRVPVPRTSSSAGRARGLRPRGTRPRGAARARPLLPPGVRSARGLSGPQED